MDAKSAYRRKQVKRGIGRRAAFFWITSFVCVAMVPAAPPEFRWVAWATAGLGFAWSILLSVEELLTPRGRTRDRFLPEIVDTPFSPPPPPGDARGHKLGD